MSWILAFCCSVAIAGPVKARIHREAAKWEPIEVRSAAAPGPARNAFSWKLHQAPKGKKGHAGPSSKTRVVARSYRAKDDTLLVVSVFPQALTAQRLHLELRFLLVEGYLDEASVVAVTAGSGAGPDDDAQALRDKGISFQEEVPVAGSLTISALDARASKGAFNAGSLRLAEFSRPGLGFVSLDYAARGVR